MEVTQPLMNVQVYASPQEFINQIQNLPYINKSLEELAASPVAIVYYGGPCCNIKCCIPCSCFFNCNCDCGDNFTYNTLVINNEEQKYLFKNLGRLDCKICSTDNMGRFAYVKNLNLSSYEQYGSNLGTESAEMTREKNCVCLGCCSNFFPVNIKSENRIAGIVRYKGCLEDCCKCKCKCDCSLCFGCCCSICEICKCNLKDICFDYYYCCDILSPDKQLVYTIFLRRYCLSACPTDCLDSFTFIIKNPEGKDVGRIEMRRTCCTLCGLLGKSCTYTINFPLDATPELKLTIINAVISIDMFVF